MSGQSWNAEEEEDKVGLVWSFESFIGHGDAWNYRCSGTKLLFLLLCFLLVCVYV